MKHERIPLGQVIRVARKARNFSQETLAYESGVNRTYLSQIERGVQQPTVNTLLKLAEALNTSAGDLLRIAEDMAANEGDSQQSADRSAEHAPLPAERVEEWEREMQTFLAAGNYEAAMSYFKLKLLEAHLLGVRDGLKQREQR